MIKRNGQKSKLKALSIEAASLGGLLHSSDEAPVMGVEQRGQLIARLGQLQPHRGKTAAGDAKPYDYTLKEVQEAFRLVKARRGAAGIDRQSIEGFEANLDGNLYKIYNRLASGSYFPPPVKAVAIPKKSGGERILGIPTVGDRVAQMVIKRRLEPILEPVFHTDSYAYRPGKSAHQALQVTRKRCWQYGWVVEFDIAKLFDCIDHQLLMKAMRHHHVEKSILMYVERWLKAPIQNIEGLVEQRTMGTPQGGVVSPLLANLFLHYVFDVWMTKAFPDTPFCRYADDALVHCQSLREAKQVLTALASRLEECGLTIHPDKTHIVCCQKSGTREQGIKSQFTFLGFTFRQRASLNRRTGELFDSFSPGISLEAEKSIRARMRSMPFTRLRFLSLQEIATYSRPYIQGWVNYYCLFNRALFSRVSAYFNLLLLRWAMSKFKHLRGKRNKTLHWFYALTQRSASLFPHWKLGWTRVGG